MSQVTCLAFAFVATIGTTLSESVSMPTDYDPNCASKWKNIHPHHTMCIVGDVGTNVPLKQATKDAIVERHNRVRARVDPPAADMAKVMWDDNLAIVAAKWARQCLKRHDVYKGVPTLPDVSVGQNIAIGHRHFRAAMGGWIIEKSDFVYGVGSNMTIGHYTQMVNAHVQRVGCGRADCPGTRFYVCNYAASQVSVRFPYKNSTTSCSDCPKHCDASGKLCDCGDKFCVHDGVLNVSDCTCSCPHTMYTGDTCNTLNCPEADHRFCGPGNVYPPSVCDTKDWAPFECPYMCGVCKHGCGSKLCHNGGQMSWTTCQCTCPDAFEGDTCEIPKCGNKICLNGGHMDWNTCQCQCSTYYEGDTCEIERCGGERCEHGGTLDAETCTCRCWLAWTGNRCQTLNCPATDDRRCGPEREWPPETCGSHFISNGHCPNMCGVCQNSCANKVCRNRGLLDYSSCTCDCMDWYTGETCDKAKCPPQDQSYCGSGWATACYLYSFVLDNCPYYCGLCKAACSSTQKVCQNGGTLDEASCTCRCPSHFIGDTCQLRADGLVNVALSKPAKMSSLHERATAEKATDGNLDMMFNHGSCISTSVSVAGPPWWFVDLGKQYNVQAVTITSRGDCCGYHLLNFAIKVFAEDPQLTSSAGLLCAEQRNAMATGVTETFVCASRPLRGRYVQISQQERKMQFCEVEVMTRPE